MKDKDMREPSVSETSFPTARCDTCDKAVLTYVDIDDDGREMRRCVHCDGIVDAKLRWVTADELEADGYYFGAPPAKGGGCGGGGCGSCSTGRR